MITDGVDRKITDQDNTVSTNKDLEKKAILFQY